MCVKPKKKREKKKTHTRNEVLHIARGKGEVWEEEWGTV